MHFNKCLTQVIFLIFKTLLVSGYFPHFGGDKTEAQNN